MRVLVTGAAGSIGSEIVRQYAEEGNLVTGIDINEVGVFDLAEELGHLGHDVVPVVGDVRDRDWIAEAVRKASPDLILHAAAYKCVTPMENQPWQAINANVLGTYNVLQAARDSDIPKLVFISTDKAASMKCVMGASKRMGEILTKSFGYVTVRFGNVMGSRGSVVPFWKNQLERGQPVTVTDKRCERYFMTIPDAVTLVREAAEKGEEGETWILNMGSPVNIYDLARTVIRESGKGEDYPIKIIGLRDGEALTERLMTPDEEERAEREGNFYVIR